MEQNLKYFIKVNSSNKCKKYITKTIGKGKYYPLDEILNNPDDYVENFNNSLKTILDNNGHFTPFINNFFEFFLAYRENGTWNTFYQYDSSSFFSLKVKYLLLDQSKVVDDLLNLTGLDLFSDSKKININSDLLKSGFIQNKLLNQFLGVNEIDFNLKSFVVQLKSITEEMIMFNFFLVSSVINLFSYNQIEIFDFYHNINNFSKKNEIDLNNNIFASFSKKYKWFLDHDYILEQINLCMKERFNHISQIEYIQFDKIAINIDNKNIKLNPQKTLELNSYLELFGTSLSVINYKSEESLDGNIINEEFIYEILSKTDDLEGSWSGLPEIKEVNYNNFWSKEFISYVDQNRNSAGYNDDCFRFWIYCPVYGSGINDRNYFIFDSEVMSLIFPEEINSYKVFQVETKNSDYFHNFIWDVIFFAYSENNLNNFIVMYGTDID